MQSEQLLTQITMNNVIWMVHEICRENKARDTKINWFHVIFDNIRVYVLK